MTTLYTSRFNDDECTCGAGPKVMSIDNLTKSRTLLRCIRCRGIVCWWDHETDEEQLNRIINYKKRNNIQDWTDEELERLRPKLRNWTEDEVKELA